MGGKRSSLQKKAVASVGARVRAFVREIAAVQLDSGSGRKAESILTFLDSLAEREKFDLQQRRQQDGARTRSRAAYRAGSSGSP